ncbi:MAG: tetratricopeptide repeat protein [Vicinamibacteria bacterium]
MRALVLLLLSATASAQTAPAARPAARGTATAASFDRLAKDAASARQAGRLEDAVSLYGRALVRRPGWTEGRWAMASLLYDLDRYADARTHFRRVVAERPQDGTAAVLLALCEFQLGDYAATAASIKRAHELGVPNPDVQSAALFHTALLLNHAGNPDGAFAILRGFAAKGVDKPAVIEAFGLSVLRMTAMPKELTPEQRQMVVLAGRGGYHMARGRRTAVGRLALEELVSRYPSVPNVHYALGSYIAPDDPDAAVEEFRRELRASPQHVPAMLQMAMIELRRGNAAAALPLAEEGVRLAPEVPASHLALGRALLETGENERAVSALERSAALAPDSADVQFALGRAYQRAGRTADAERARQEFLRLDRAAKASEAAAEAPPEPEEPGGAARREGGSR